MSLHVMLELVICRSSTEPSYCPWTEMTINDTGLLVTIKPVPFTSLSSMFYRNSHPWYLRKRITKSQSAYQDQYLPSLFPLGILLKAMSQQYLPKHTLLPRGCI